jgi:hypothetical protein
MRLLVALSLLLLTAVPSSAGTIVWFASGELTAVNDPPINRLPDGSLVPVWGDLKVGTPWSLTVEVDPAAPISARLGSFGASLQNCNAYPVGASTFTLGGFTYTQPGGELFTNFVPFGGCASSIGFDTGMMSFHWFDDWSHERGAWDLSGVMIAMYTELLETDGGLPATPTPTSSGQLSNFLFYVNFNGPPGPSFNAAFNPVALTQAAPVPEPATMTMLGAGLAALIARRRRRC